jgi:RTX calcium-binding nonapeptide repeat (4 copies)
MRRRQLSLLGLCLVLAVPPLAAGAAAKRIVGTTRNDVLRGTPRADVIYGKAGNDKLYGRGGNDRLYGGPGADRFFCGPGRDTVYVDLRDKIGRDCEIVRRLRPPKPPPPPPPPPPPLVAPGHYVAPTNQSRDVTFDVNGDGVTIAHLRMEYNAQCDPPGTISGAIATYSGTLVITNARTFSLSSSTADGSLTITINASFAADGTVSGTFDAHTVQTGPKATKFTCDSGTVEFVGKLQQ